MVSEMLTWPETFPAVSTFPARLRHGNTTFLPFPCFLAGYTQTMNDWYDRDIDAINEPYRPIPSGAISENEVITQIWVLFLAGLAIAGGLDVWAGHKFPTLFYLALGGSFISYIYSAPPLKSLNSKYGSKAPLVLMNSFNTHKDTLKIVEKYTKSNVEIVFVEFSSLALVDFDSDLGESQEVY